jgi:predicted nucleic acid-binding protein
MAILVDSTFYIAQQRAGRDPRHQLEPWLTSGTLWICGVVRAEVLRGVIKPNIRQDFAEFFDLLPRIEADWKLWEEISELAWNLDRQGLVLPLTDIAIACCALRENATLISSDQHFRQVPRLRVREALPEILL